MIKSHRNWWLLLYLSYEKIILIVAFICSQLSFAQKSFVFDVVDSSSKSKNELYSDIKQFIATYYKSAQNIIQNDDKEAGVVTIKPLIIKTIRFMMVDYTYEYSYIATFKMKDKKYKVTIDNVTCTNSYSSARKSSEIDKIQPFIGDDNCPATGTMSHPGPTKSKVITMMDELYNDLK